MRPISHEGSLVRSLIIAIIGSTAVIPREYAGFGLDIQRL